MCWWSGQDRPGLAVAACRNQGVDVLMVARLRRRGLLAEALRPVAPAHPARAVRLPGLRMPRRLGRWVAKDDVAAYLADYAAHHGLTPRLETAVLRLEQDGDSWKAHTDGEPLQVRQVVLATGTTPSPSSRPGRVRTPSAARCASAYANATPYRGKDVLVVGAGNTGAEIAADLAENGAAEVWLAVRTPPNVSPAARSIPTTLLAISMDFSPAWLADPINRFRPEAVRRRPDPVRAAGPAQRHSSIQMRATGVPPRRSTSV